jgi:hypothetical protein
VPYDPEELAARARAGRMPHPEAAPRVHVIPGTPAVPGVVGTPTPAVPRPSAVAERIAAQVAPPRAGVKRVVLLEMANSTGRPELAPLAESMAGALARKVASSDGYELADPRATRLALAAGLRSGAVAAATHSGAAVYGNVLLARDHVTYLVQIWDARRNYAKVVRARRPLEGGDEAKALAELADAVQEQLADWVRWEPKQP